MSRQFSSFLMNLLLITFMIVWFYVLFEWLLFWHFFFCFVCFHIDCSPYLMAPTQIADLKFYSKKKVTKIAKLKKTINPYTALKKRVKQKSTKRRDGDISITMLPCFFFAEGVMKKDGGDRISGTPLTYVCKYVRMYVRTYVRTLGLMHVRTYVRKQNERISLQSEVKMRS